MLNYHIFKKAFYSIGKQEYKYLFILLILTIFTSFTELISIGLIIPLLNLFLDNDYLKYFQYFNFFNLESKNDILIFILLIFGLAHLFKFFLNRYLIILHQSFSNNLNLKISKKLFSDYIYKDFIFYTNKNSAELIRNIISESNLFSFGVILMSLKLISESIIFISIMIVLFIFNLEITLIIIIFFSVVGYYLLKSNSKNLKSWGEKRQICMEKIYKILNESFASYRELVLNNLQNIFFKNFSLYAEKNAELQIKKEVSVQMPRLAMELITIIMLILIVTYLIIRGNKLDDIFILLGVFLYAAVRILPSVNKIIQSIQSIKFNNAVIDVVYEQIKNIDNQKIDKNFDKVKLEYKTIKFNNISFFYKKNEPLLNNLNFEVKKGEKIGLIGKSGSGKTTLINLFSGLLKPKNGNIEIDKKNIENIIKKYQGEIGYVPQKVTVFDESILFNITLELDNRKIDFERFNKILKEVDLYEIINNLPNKINESAGEEGSKFSGGQCQRLGIARILYRNPNIIILDEATSSLDTDTEAKILDSLFKNYKENTIFLSTHRTIPLKFCDTIYEINNKNLKKISNE